MSDKPRVLCVDDEENILEAIRRSLRKKFEIHTATSGKEGLAILQSAGPFQVVVSDMKMPQMNGVSFLKQARKMSPQTVRLLLTGYAEMDTVVGAINEGHIFRFMTKPCSAGDLLTAIEAALVQYDLQMAEKVLLEQTLKGSIAALTEVLSLANPEAFGRATRICSLVTGLAERQEMENIWQVEMAAMLSQIGAVTLPQETAGKVYRGENLSELEAAMVARIPEINLSVLANIPRLEPILEIFTYLSKNFDGSGTPKNKLSGEEIPLGSRILKVAMRTEEMQGLGNAPSRILDDMRAQVGVYDPSIVAMIDQVIDLSGDDSSVRGVTLVELRTGMLLTEEVKTIHGLLLVAADQEVTVSLLERIQNYNDTVGLQLPMWVEVPKGSGPDEYVAAEDSTEQPNAVDHKFNFS